MVRVDLRKDKEAKIFANLIRKCGCVCVGCGWRGWRIIHFSMDLRLKNFDPTSVTGVIKGLLSQPSCCRCGNQVRFTHVNRHA